MAQVPVMNAAGKEIDKVTLPADIFEVEVNVGLMHQAFVRQMANARQGTNSTKRRGEVRGSTAKIYRQKGTGRARHGARTAPIFVGGGQAHGPKPRSYEKDMPKKMRRGAIRSALSALLRDEQLVIIDKFGIDQPRTKDIKQILQALTGGENALVLFTEGSENIQRSVSNLPKAQALRANYLNVRDLLQYDKVILPLDALDVIVSIWGTQKEGATNA
ncbi:50S ribosomal protein L4 [Phototrophicus methaneseepsis]|uniref:Large ribosomal subunit protein uL4 n=1 Tax=Phototrophicus methaneseepsis TaxID=2710758 RepID=A0A7S8ED78_9CHLR|nr:50S ribosomal protein L4 [Phototrophicus methaneseepsis]QPC84801.1 50S ribosomal protein L4 [Phototrophicus methaneseepsis]